MLGTPGTRGRPAYAAYREGEAVQAVALCLWRKCTTSFRPRHVRLAAPPVLDGLSADEGAGVNGALLRALGDAGAAEVVVESFGASYTMDTLPGDWPDAGSALPDRIEFRVPLHPHQDEDALLANMSSSHRRKARTGESAGWTLEPLEGALGSEVLAMVQDSAAERREHRYRDSFEVRQATGIEGAGDGDAYPAWGTLVFAARSGDEILSAALVGWGGARAFYVSGGSTPAGYESSAAFWLHWRIMAHLRRHGFRSYNLGGVPVSARTQGDPQYGLRRFKLGFGAEEVECRGRGYVLRPAHQRLHRVGGLLRRALPG